jgi:ABC-type multidrug transport system ATPase subunit
MLSSAGGKTSITVAHRLNTIRNCDAIFVMSHGRIVERGHHDELMGLDSGLYRKFVNDQANPNFSRLSSKVYLERMRRRSSLTESRQLQGVSEESEAWGVANTRISDESFEC